MKKILLLLIIPLLSFGQGWEQTLYKNSEDVYNTCDYYNDIIKIAEKMGDNINNIKDLELDKEFDRLTKLTHDIPHTEICGNYDDFLEALNIIKYVSDLHFKMDKTLTPTFSDKTYSNMDRYDIFQMRAKNNPEKIGKWNDLAQELKEKTNVVDVLIDSIRYELWKAGGPTVDGQSLEIKDDWEDQKSLNYVVTQLGGYELIDKANRNSPAIIMLGPGGERGAGIRLKNVLSEYREYLLELDLYSLSDTTIKTLIRKMFDTSDKQNDTSGGIITWEENQYRGFPLVAVLTFLNQTKLDVRTAEDIMLELLEQKTGE